MPPERRDQTTYREAGEPGRHGRHCLGPSGLCHEAYRPTDRAFRRPAFPQRRACSEGRDLGLHPLAALRPGMPWPDPVGDVQFDEPPTRVGRGELRVSYVAHATVLVQFDGLNILTDPVWAERSSPVTFAGPRRVRPPAVRWEHLPPIDVILVSHNHYDHLDTDTLGKLWRCDRPVIFTPLANPDTCAPAIRISKPSSSTGSNRLPWIASAPRWR